MGITTTDALMFLLFDKIVYEIQLEKGIIENLAKDPKYQKILQEKNEADRNIRRAKREKAKVHKEQEKRRKKEA